MADPTLRVSAISSADETGDLKKLASTNNEFALGLFAKLRSQAGDGKNVVCSPFSTSLALAIAYAGARGGTAKEMSQALRFPFDQDRLPLAFAKLTSELRSGSNVCETRLDLADALWGQKGDPFLEEFRKPVESQYGAHLGEVDCWTNADDARQVINRWAEEKTKGKIRELVGKEIGPETSLILTNSVYFLAAWDKQFPKGQTRDDEFLVPGKEKKHIRMMNQTGTLPYAESEGCQVLELPYKDQNDGLVLLLPEEDGLTRLERSLNVEKLDRMLGALKPQTLGVAIPRFRIEEGLHLKKPLVELGMKSAFGSSADFSGMTGKRGLFLTEVIQQAMVDVREEGTEAAAATAVAVGRAFTTIRFRADRPFLFVIRHRPTNTILFIGLLIDP